MRVIYFHQYFSTRSGAAGTRSYEMARALAARGHHVLMVCGSAARGATGLSQPFVRGRRRGMVDGIEVLEFELGYSNDMGLARRALAFGRFAARSAAAALREPCDLVFATSTPLTAGLPGIAARWLRRKPFVFEVRDLWPELPRAMGVVRNTPALWALSALEWLSYRSARRLVALAPGIVDGIARRGVGREAVAMIPNGCDLDLFAPGASAPWRPAGVRCTDLLAVFAGAHGRANGLDAVLDAAAVLGRMGRDDIRLLLVGEGRLKAHLQRRAAREGLSNVTFHEPLEKARLAGLLAASDVGLQILDNVPSFYQGTSPNKFFDYLAAGLPVLINYPGWLAGLVEEHDCGFAVPPADPAALAAALVRAADDRPALRGMGCRGRALGESRFDRRVLAAAFVEWLEGVVTS
jgi:glycosyltransferase involved in cell wall biosynthesis